MRARSALLEALGGEEGCRRLSAACYARVSKDPVLRPFFPGKSLRCATEEFAAFLIQFLDGDEKQTQYRWWLSLRESHARFQIGPNARLAWLRHMEGTLDAAPLDDATRNALRHFFSRSSAYVIGRDTAESDHEELAARWSEQRVLDSVIAAIVEGRDDETLALAPRFASRSEEHTSELQSRLHLVCRLLLEKKKSRKFLQVLFSLYRLLLSQS